MVGHAENIRCVLQLCEDSLCHIRLHFCSIIHACLIHSYYHSHLGLLLQFVFVYIVFPVGK